MKNENEAWSFLEAQLLDKIKKLYEIETEQVATGDTIMNKSKARLNERFFQLRMS